MRCCIADMYMNITPLMTEYCPGHTLSVTGQYAEVDTTFKWVDENTGAHISDSQTILIKKSMVGIHQKISAKLLLRGREEFSKEVEFDVISKCQ